MPMRSIDCGGMSYEVHTGLACHVNAQGSKVEQMLKDTIEMASMQEHCHHGSSAFKWKVVQRIDTRGLRVPMVLLFRVHSGDCHLDISWQSTMREAGQ